MRTTLTLDDDVAARLAKLAARRRMSFKETVNTVLRRGLATSESRSAETRPFRVRTFHGAFRPGIDPQRLNQLVDELDIQRLAKASS
jgi:Arc/MetJ family transcription regulator